MLVKQLKVGPMENFAYILADESTKQAALIDPCWQLGYIYKEVQNNSLIIEHVLLTHGHYDHYKELAPFLKEHNLYAQMHEADLFLADGIDLSLIRTFNKEITIKNGGLDIKVIHTPGHSPGSVCYYAQDCLFTGDTLFVGATGRVDLPGSNAAQMRESLIKLAQLPPETKVYSGHAYGESDVSTIGHEKETNAYVKLALRHKK